VVGSAAVRADRCSWEERMRRIVVVFGLLCATAAAAEAAEPFEKVW
jgi:hypothetical protein